MPPPSAAARLRAAASRGDWKAFAAVAGPEGWAAVLPPPEVWKAVLSGYHDHLGMLPHLPPVGRTLPFAVRTATVERLSMSGCVAWLDVLSREPELAEGFRPAVGRRCINLTLANARARQGAASAAIDATVVWWLARGAPPPSRLLENAVDRLMPKTLALILASLAGQKSGLPTDEGAALLRAACQGWYSSITKDEPTGRAVIEHLLRAGVSLDTPVKGQSVRQAVEQVLTEDRNPWRRAWDESILPLAKAMALSRHLSRALPSADKRPRARL